MLYLIWPLKREVWHAIKPGSIPHNFFLLQCPLLSQAYGHCYIIVRFCVCYILMLCFRCVVCFLLFFSVYSHYYKTCHGTYLSQIHVFVFDVISVILIGFCLMLCPFLCYILMLCRFTPLIFNAFPSVLACYPDFVFLSMDL